MTAMKTFSALALAYATYAIPVPFPEDISPQFSQSYSDSSLGAFFRSGESKSSSITESWRKDSAYPDNFRSRQFNSDTWVEVLDGCYGEVSDRAGRGPEAGYTQLLEPRTSAKISNGKWFTLTCGPPDAVALLRREDVGKSTFWMRNRINGVHSERADGNYQVFMQTHDCRGFVTDNSDTSYDSRGEFTDTTHAGMKRGWVAAGKYLKMICNGNGNNGNNNGNNNGEEQIVRTATEAITRRRSDLGNGAEMSFNNGGQIVYIAPRCSATRSNGSPLLAGQGSNSGIYANEKFKVTCENY